MSPQTREICLLRQDKYCTIYLLRQEKYVSSDKINTIYLLRQEKYVSSLDKVNMSSQVGEICPLGQGKFVQSGRRNMSSWTG
jgi:hypothetical protein